MDSEQFYLGAITNSAAINILVSIFWWTDVHISKEENHGVGVYEHSGSFSTYCENMVVPVFAPASSGSARLLT